MIVKELVARLGLNIDEAAFSKADALIAGLSRGFLAFGTAALGAVAVGLVAITKSAANAADHFKKLSQATGVDSITLQEYAYSADLAGVSNEELAHGLEHLAKTGVKDVHAAVLKLADRFAKMPDDGHKVELAMEKFGRAGARMIPWLNGGAKGMRDLAQEAHDLGVIFDKDAQNAAEDFNDNITRLGYGLAGLRNVIGAAVLPVLNKLVLALLSFVKFIRMNWKPIIAQLTLALKTLAFILGGVLLAALVANIAAVATAVSWYVALSVAAVAAALSAAAAWLAAVAPVALLAAAFAAMLLVLEDIYVYLKGGDSLIGEMLPKWNEFYGTFSELHRADPWWLTALKLASRLLDHMLLPLRNLIEVGSIFIPPDVAKNVTAPSQVFGGGASPAASARAKNPKPVSAKTANFLRSQGYDMSSPVDDKTMAFIREQGLDKAPAQGPTIITHVTNHITQSPGMNSQDVVDKVNDQVGNHITKLILETVAGVF